MDCDSFTRYEGLDFSYRRGMEGLMIERCIPGIELDLRGNAAIRCFHPRSIMSGRYFPRWRAARIPYRVPSGALVYADVLLSSASPFAAPQSF